MKNYNIESYGDKLSDHYDRMYQEFPPYPGQIEFLKSKTMSAPALELGVGTGRIALPLALSGVSVIGMDSSENMLDLLLKRSHDLPVIGIKADASNFLIDEKINLAFAVFNLIFLLPSRESQVSCFRSVRKALNSNGCFVIECFVPSPDSYLPDGASPGFFPIKSSVNVRSISNDHVSLFASINDSENQVWRFQEIHLSADAGVKLFPCVMNYQSPTQLDLIAKEAGMCLVERYENWLGSHFSYASKKHISVYRPI